MTDTKKIIFEGREYTVPVWVEWVARDGSGFIGLFERKPLKIVDSWIRDIGKYEMVNPYQANWRDSLTKV